MNNKSTSPWMSLSSVQQYEGLAASRGVSEVARSPRGFLTAYKRAGGDWRRLSEHWRRKREAFIARHMAQMRTESLYEQDGTPSRRHLALIMWAYDPTIRKNSMKTRYARNVIDLKHLKKIEREYMGFTWDYPIETSDDITEEERNAIAKLGYYGKEILSGDAKKIAEGKNWKPKREYYIIYNCVDGSGTEYFKTKEDMTKFIKDRWMGPDFVDGPRAFHTDYCRYYLPEEITFDDLGISYATNPRKKRTVKNPRRKERERVPLPENIRREMKMWDIGFGDFPQSYIEFHKKLAEDALLELISMGFEVHKTWMQDSGWADGMYELHAIIQYPKTPTTRHEIIEIVWNDTNQGWMKVVNGASIWYPED